MAEHFVRMVVEVPSQAQYFKIVLTSSGSSVQRSAKKRKGVNRSGGSTILRLLWIEGCPYHPVSRDVQLVCSLESTVCKLGAM